MAESTITMAAKETMTAESVASSTRAKKQRPNESSATTPREAASASAAATSNAAAATATEDVNDDDDEDVTFPSVDRQEEKDGEFWLKMIDKEWIRWLSGWADAHCLSDECLLEGLQILAICGGEKLEDLILSESTIHRLRQDEQGHAHLSVNLDEYDRFVTIHFDGKRVKMGANQGGQLLEHLAILVSGISGVKQLSIEIAANSTG